MGLYIQEKRWPSAAAAMNREHINSVVVVSDDVFRS